MRRMVTENELNSLDERITALEEGGGTVYDGGYGIYKDDAEKAYYFTGNGTNTIALTENGTGIDFSVKLKSGCGISADSDGLKLDSNIAAASANIANNIEIYSDNNAFAIYCSNNALPFEIGSVTGAWFRIGTDGAISLTSIDANTSTAHLYEFKSDGIYLDNTKITN